jgi:TonB family protein
VKFISLLMLISAFATPAPAQTFGEKPADFDGVQQPTERPAVLNTPLEVRYPDSAMQSQRQGMVLVSAWIDRNGYVTYAEVTRGSGHTDLDIEALRAVVEGDFNAARRDGTRCASRVSVPVEFRLSRSEDEYDAVKDSEQLRQEAEELRRARDMLQEEQRQLEEEIRRLKEQQSGQPEEQNKIE